MVLEEQKNCSICDVHREGAGAMSYTTLMARSVVVIPKTRDDKSSAPVKETAKKESRIDGETDFEAMLDRR